MPILRFTGRVLVPPSIRIDVNNLPVVQYFESLLSLAMTYKVSIVNSEVRVDIAIDRFEEDYLSPLYARALDFVRAAIDIIAFANGYGLGVYLEKAIKPDGSWIWIMPRDERLKRLSTAINADPSDTSDKNFDATFRRVIREPGLFMALNDLIAAITQPHHAPISCARAVEGLRILVVGAGADRKQNWSLFRDALNVDQAYLEFITDLSKAPRHGDRTFIPGRDVEETISRTWTLMDRFLEYRRRGNLPLPPSEFPRLI